MGHDDQRIVEREIHHIEERPRRGGVLAGFLVALLLIAGAIVAYFAVSDDDNDGQLDLDVPAVEVDVGSGADTPGE